MRSSWNLSSWRPGKTKQSYIIEVIKPYYFLTFQKRFPTYPFYLAGPALPHSPSTAMQVEINPDLRLSEILKDKTVKSLIQRSSALPNAWLLPSLTMSPAKCCPTATGKQQLHDFSTSLARQFVHAPQSCSALFYCYQPKWSRGLSTELIHVLWQWEYIVMSTAE